MFLICGSQVADKQDAGNLVVGVFASKADFAIYPSCRIAPPYNNL